MVNVYKEVSIALQNNQHNRFSSRLTIYTSEKVLFVMCYCSIVVVIRLLTFIFIARPNKNLKCDANALMK